MSFPWVEGHPELQDNHQLEEKNWFLLKNNNDRDCMWFLWWGDYGSRKLVEFRHYHVAFVVSPSLAFVLGASLLYHLNKSPNELKNTTKKLKFSICVNNCKASVSNEAELNMFVAESQTFLYKAKFDS